MRNELLAEHLDVDVAEVEEAIRSSGSLLGAVRALRKPSGRTLRPLHAREFNEVEEIVAQSHIADPERPAVMEKRVTLVIKKVVLRAPWLTTFLVLFVVALFLWLVFSL